MGFVYEFICVIMIYVKNSKGRVLEIAKWELKKYEGKTNYKVIGLGILQGALKNFLDSLGKTIEDISLQFGSTSYLLMLSTNTLNSWICEEHGLSMHTCFNRHMLYNIIASIQTTCRLYVILYALTNPSLSDSLFKPT